MNFTNVFILDALDNTPFNRSLQPYKKENKSLIAKELPVFRTCRIDDDCDTEVFSVEAFKHSLAAAISTVNNHYCSSLNMINNVNKHKEMNEHFLK